MAQQPLAGKRPLVLKLHQRRSGGKEVVSAPEVTEIALDTQRSRVDGFRRKLKLERERDREHCRHF